MQRHAHFLLTAYIDVVVFTSASIKEPSEKMDPPPPPFLAHLSIASRLFSSPRRLTSDLSSPLQDLLHTVFQNGKIVKTYTFDDVRDNAKLKDTEKEELLK